MGSSSSWHHRFIQVGVTLLLLSGVPYLLQPGRGALRVNAAMTSFEKVSNHFKYCQMGVDRQKAYEAYMQKETGDSTWNKDDPRCPYPNMEDCKDRFNAMACRVKRARVKVPHCTNLEADPDEIVPFLPLRTVTAYTQFDFLFNNLGHGRQCIEKKNGPDLNFESWTDNDHRIPPEVRKIMYDAKMPINVKVPAHPPLWSYIIDLLFFLLCVALLVYNGKKWLGKTQVSASGHASASHSQAAESWQTYGHEGTTGGLHSLSADGASFPEYSSSMATSMTGNQSAIGTVQQTPSQMPAGQMGAPTGMVSSSGPTSTLQPPLPTANVSMASAGEAPVQQALPLPSLQQPVQPQPQSPPPHLVQPIPQPEPQVPVQSLPEAKPQFQPQSHAPQSSVQAAPMAFAGNQQPEFADPGQQTVYPPGGPPASSGPRGFPPRSAGFPPGPPGYPPGPRGFPPRSAGYFGSGPRGFPPRSAGYPAPGPAGYPPGPPGYPPGPRGFPPRSAGYPAPGPGGFPPGPRGFPPRSAGYPAPGPGAYPPGPRGYP